MIFICGSWKALWFPEHYKSRIGDILHHSKHGKPGSALSDTRSHLQKLIFFAVQLGSQEDTSQYISYSHVGFSIDTALYNMEKPL